MKNEGKNKCYVYNDEKQLAEEFQTINC